jgi:copper chaperone CopZ
MAQTQLAVSGMTCDHCVRHVTDAISKVAGVNSVNVNLADGIAEIESDSALDLQAVKDAVVAAGYSA